MVQHPSAERAGLDVLISQGSGDKRLCHVNKELEWKKLESEDVSVVNSKICRIYVAVICECRCNYIPHQEFYAIVNYTSYSNISRNTSSSTPDPIPSPAAPSVCMCFLFLPASTMSGSTNARFAGTLNLLFTGESNADAA